MGLHQFESPDDMAAFLEQTGVTFPVLPDEGFTLSEIAFPPDNGFPYPRDIVIDKQGRIRSIRSTFDPDEMEALVASLLAE